MLPSDTIWQTPRGVAHRHRRHRRSCRRVFASPVSEEQHDAAQQRRREGYVSRYGTVEPSSTQARPRSTSRTGTRAAGPGQWPVGDQMTPPPRPAGRQRGITAWPIRRKLAALVAVPMTAILIGSGALIGATLSDLRDARQARELAAVGIVVNHASRALLEERTISIANLQGTTEQTKAELAKARGVTDQAVTA